MFRWIRRILFDRALDAIRDVGMPAQAFRRVRLVDNFLHGRSSHFAIGRAIT
jgi:hypothetical protein